MRKIISALAILFAMVGCASTEQYMQMSSEQLCVDYLYYTGLNINQNARKSAILSRNLDCMPHINTARAKRDATNKEFAERIQMGNQAYQENLQATLNGLSSMSQRLNQPEGVLGFGPVQLSETCFHKSEAISGLNKICYFECPSGRIAHNIASHELCPGSLQKR